jgi:phage terminase small subunit
MLNSPKGPSHLSRPARRRWQEIVETWELDADGLMLLEVALGAWDRLREARLLIASSKEGIVLTDPSGRQRAHPALQVEKEARLAFLKAWRQLGLEDGVERPEDRRRRYGSLNR